MTHEVMLAIITSVASLLVALTSLISSIIANRQSARSTEIIELLKFRLDDKKSTRAMSDEYLRQGIESLGTLIQVIQRMKDIVQLTLNAVGTSLDSESALENISKARQQLFKSFEEQLPYLRESEVRGAHQAKNTALTIEMRLCDDLEGTFFTSELSEEQRQSLLELRNDLTDAQHLLRDSRATLILNRIQVNE
jgi:hypothetical protein